MSTYAELLARTKRRFGRKNYNFDVDFLDEMKSAQEELEEGPTLPNWLLKDLTATPNPITAGTTSFVLSHTNGKILRLRDDRAIEYLDSDGNLQQMWHLDTYQQLKQKKDNGIPSGKIYYWIDRQDDAWTVHFEPEQTYSLTVIVNGFAPEATLTGSNENGWLRNEPQLIVGLAGVNLASWLRDDRALQYFQGLEQRGRRRMITRVESEVWADSDLVMGDPD